mgnify:CR=1 FL=1
MIRIILVTALAVLLAPSPKAAAAPQILALSTTGVPQPLHCLGRTCSAVLSSFCLQPNRSEPFAGQSYAPADAANLVLVGETLDGRQRNLRLTGHLRFAANEPIASIAVSIDREYLTARNLRRVAIQVKARTTLLPLVAADDDSPLTPAEIAQASGPAGELSEVFFEDGPLWGKARLMTALMSRPPVLQRASAPASRRLWQDAVGPTLERAVPAGAISDTRAVLDGCRTAIENGTAYNLRSCLERRHGTIMRRRNEELWKAQQAIW